MMKMLALTKILITGLAVSLLTSCGTGETNEPATDTSAATVSSTAATEATTTVSTTAAETEAPIPEGMEFTQRYGTVPFYSVTKYTASETEVEVVIPSEFRELPVKQIDDQAFRDCTAMTRIVIPEGVTSIGEWAFWGCYSLKSIDMPASVTSVGKFAFYTCSGAVFYYGGTKAQWEEISVNILALPDKYTAHCADGDITVP